MVKCKLKRFLSTCRWSDPITLICKRSLNSCFLFSEKKKATAQKKKALLGVRIGQVKNYKKLFNASRAARSILDLQSVMKLTGDFSEVESIAEVSCKK